MTTAELGNGDVSVTRMEALASELRLLKSAMSDVQGRLDGLLIEIGNELQSAPVASEASVEVLEAPQAAIEVQEAIEAPAAVEIEPALVADVDLTFETVEDTALVMVEEAVVEIRQIETPTEVIETAVVTDTDIAVAETQTVEAIVSTEIEATEAAAQTEAVIEVATEAAPAEVAEVAAEPVVLEVSPEAPAEVAAIEAQPAVVETVAEAPAVETLPENVVPAEVLAERRNARKARSAVARVGRWAAVIALIAVCAGLVATGTGFAGHGEILSIKRVCAAAGDVCTIMPGIP